MFDQLWDKLEFLGELRKHRILRWAFFGWAIISIYDTGGSQFLPPEWAQKRPTVYQLVAMTTGWISLEGWLLIGAAGLVIFAVQHVARYAPNRRTAAPRPRHPIVSAPPSIWLRAGSIASCSIIIVGVLTYYAIWPVVGYAKPGFFTAASMRIYDTPEPRRKYIFDFLAPTGARISFYISPSDTFVLSAIDVNLQPHILEIPISSGAIPINRSIFLYCEVELQDQSTLLRVLVNGQQVAEQPIPIRVNLGKEYWKWKAVTFGADIHGENNAPFKVSAFANGHKLLTDKQVLSFYKAIEKFLADVASNP
jgi:hypothetical protein